MISDTNDGHPVSTKLIKPEDLRRMLDDVGEIAVLDVREEGVYARDGHILLAANLPLSHMEMRVQALLPRKSVRIAVCDDGSDLGPAAAARLTALGYANVLLLDGGVQAWRAAGLRLYTGMYVPSKAFGEYIFHHDRTPEVTAAEFLMWQAAGRDMVILDSRPLEEYRRKTIPGAIDCPGAELAYRIDGLVRSAQTTVIVNCGGRTRSIIGAQSLINAGVENPVFALKDGTQGWHLQGHKLAYGCFTQAPPPTAHGIARARQAAARVARRFGVRMLERSQFEALVADRQRTVYVLDVRSPEEFAAGHLREARSAPGGQLVQATDTYLAVRRSTAVLVDDDGVRATMTAAWLMQMGWQHIFVLMDALNTPNLEHGARAAEVPGLEDIQVAMVTAAELHVSLQQPGTQVVDLNNSLSYREEHIPGAWHAVRSRLRQNLAAIPDAKRFVFTSPDAVLARFAASDACRLTSVPVSVLQGGTAAWRKAGFELQSGSERLTGAADDVQYRALDRHADVEAAIREYLSWEVDLLKAAETDPDFNFRRFA